MKKYTVCTALNKRQNEIFAALDNNDVNKAKQIAYECLDDPMIIDRKAVATAKTAFANPNQNHFLSALMTYMTCMAVG